MFPAYKRKSACRAIRASKIGCYVLASILSGALALTAANVSAQTLTTLYSFPGGTSGSLPQAGVVADSSGNLYGTTIFGGDPTPAPCVGNSGCGLVFKLTRPTSSGSTWAETVLYPFTGSDGNQPTGNLISDPSGNLYGATVSGGDLAASSCAGAGCGVAFEIKPSGTETALHTFTGDSDGQFPMGGLTADSSLNLYGTTQSGGAYLGGTVFELVNSSGTYSTKKVLYSFVNSNLFPNMADSGYIPAGSLTSDTSGNLFGTATSGGDMSACNGFGCGVVFELVNSSGTYTEKVLYEFEGGSDGVEPETGVIEDASGNLYGTTMSGGDMSECGGSGCGVVFELVNSSGTYTEKTLYAFTGGADGSNPSASLIEDASGNLYGTTAVGGDLSGCGGSGCGVVFKVTPSGTETVLYTFTYGSDGGVPESSLIADATGNLYGTTIAGGTGGYGTVFELSDSGFVTTSRFAGVPGTRNCKGMSISTMAHTYGGIAHAATSLGYTSVAALQGAVESYCGANGTVQ